MKFYVNSIPLLLATIFGSESQVQENKPVLPEYSESLSEGKEPGKKNENLDTQQLLKVLGGGGGEIGFSSSKAKGKLSKKEDLDTGRSRDPGRPLPDDSSQSSRGSSSEGSDYTQSIPRETYVNSDKDSELSMKPTGKLVSSSNSESSPSSGHQPSLGEGGSSRHRTSGISGSGGGNSGSENPTSTLDESALLTPKEKAEAEKKYKASLAQGHPPLANDLSPEFEPPLVSKGTQTRTTSTVGTSEVKTNFPEKEQISMTSSPLITSSAQSQSLTKENALSTDNIQNQIDEVQFAAPPSSALKDAKSSSETEGKKAEALEEIQMKKGLKLTRSLKSPIDNDDLTK